MGAPIVIHTMGEWIARREWEKNEQGNLWISFPKAAVRGNGDDHDLAANPKCRLRR